MLGMTPAQRVPVVLQCIHTQRRRAILLHSPRAIQRRHHGYLRPERARNSVTGNQGNVRQQAAAAMQREPREPHSASKPPRALSALMSRRRRRREAY